MRSINPSLLLIAAALTVTSASAQNKYPLKWAPKPALHKIPDSLKKESAVFILEERQAEIVEKDKDYELYRTVHHIIRLQDDKGSEAFNTFTVPIGNDRKLIEIKARTILPGGKVIEVARDKIKQVKNEDGYPEYRVAMEGVEPGAEVELLFTEQRVVSSFATEVYQFGVPGLEGRFRLIVPKRLKFDSKGYNGFPEFSDSTDEERHFYTSVKYGIPTIEDEPVSLYRPFLQRLDYKLSYVDGNESNVRRFTWNDLAKQLYDSYYDLSDKEKKAAEKMLERIGVNKADEEVKKICAIEDYFKTNITIADDLIDEDAAEFNRIMEKKMSTEKGYMRFFGACLTAAGVTHEIGLVAGRYSYPMDQSIEIWDHLTVGAMYFPKANSYIAPTAVRFRYPFVPYFMGGAKGLFCKLTTLGTMTSALPDIRTIPHMAMDKSSSSITADVKFSGQDLTPTVTLTHALKGYNSAGMREAFLYVEKEKEKELVQNVTGLADKISDIQSYKVEDAAFVNFTLGKPLKLTTVVQPQKLMEKAGPKYLFKAGEIIGKQVEMYHDDKRTLPVETEYANTQLRTIRINIPAGYKIVNPEACRFNVLYTEEGKDLCGFVSDYTMEGDVMVINIREFYTQTRYPLSGYETYRKVINAAADFNKVTLVLQKV
jgi:hypothetical protein